MGSRLEQFMDLTMVGAGEPVKLPALGVSVDFFRTLECSRRWGATSRANDPDDRTGSDVIITDALWRSHFACRPGRSGRWIHSTARPHRIRRDAARFSSASCRGIGPLHRSCGTPQLFRPIEPFLFPRRPVGNMNYGALIRLKPGVSREQAASELNALLSDIYREYQLRNHDHPDPAAAASHAKLAIRAVAVAGHRWSCAPDRVRERRKSDAGPHLRPASRGRRPYGPGRRTRPACSHSCSKKRWCWSPSAECSDSR